MKLQTEGTWQVAAPWRLFAFILTSIFVVEAGVMFLLPLVQAPDAGFLSEALLDAILLTLCVAPLLWWLVVMPLRTLVRIRTQLLQRVFSIQEEEQRRIALDLHDGLGQSLTGVLVALRAIEETTTDEQLRLRLRDVRRIGSDTHDELRRIARGLRPTVLDDLGLVAALQRLADEVVSTKAVRVVVDVSDVESSRWPPAIETALYRIAQEAVNNALKHADAGEIQLHLCGSTGGVELAISDNGRGFDVAAVFDGTTHPHPFGLWNIRERAAMLSGTVQIESHLGRGTRIVAKLPVPAAGCIDGED